MTSKDQIESLERNIEILEKRVDEISVTLMELFTALVGVTSYVDVLTNEVEMNVKGFPNKEELSKKVMTDLKEVTDSIVKSGKWNTDPRPRSKTVD